MPTIEVTPAKTESLYPKAPDTLNKFIADIGNVFFEKSGASDIEDSGNGDDWKRNEASLVLTYLFNSNLRDNIKTQLETKQDPKLIDPKEVFGNLAQLKTYIFILASDPHKHYNLSYYNEKLNDLSDFAVRAYKFFNNIFTLMQTLVKLIDFSKFHDNLYVSIDKFLLIGYNKTKNELTFDVNVKKFDSLLHVRKSTMIGLGLQNFDSVIYYRECNFTEDKVKDKEDNIYADNVMDTSDDGESKAPVMKGDEESTGLFLGDEVTKMATLFGLSR